MRATPTARLPATPFTATQTLVTEAPSPGTLAWRALLSQRKGKRGGPLPRRTLVRQEVPLDAAHIAQYGAVCGFSPAHGVPMTYPHVLGFPLQLMLMTESAFPYPVIGLVHLCNTIRQHQRLQIGERVRVEVRPRRLFQHRADRRSPSRRPLSGRARWCGNRCPRICALACNRRRGRR